MRRWTWMGAAAAMAVLGAAPAAAGVLPAQYGGPGLGDPYGGPPDVGPGTAARRRGPSGPFATYHGFRIDLGEAQGAIDVPSALAEVERQIDIVDRAGVSPSMMAMFRAVPIRIAAAFAGGEGHYSGGSEVVLGSLRPDDDRPVLLHEYMHVLEYRSFPGRARNPAVVRFYAEALAGGLYPPDAYVMSSPAEFFAVTASCYLNGTVARDPYTRTTIRERQPDYYAFLARVFGPRGDTARSGAPAAVVDAR